MNKHDCSLKRFEYFIKNFCNEENLIVINHILFEAEEYLTLLETGSLVKLLKKVLNML